MVTSSNKRFADRVRCGRMSSSVTVRSRQRIFADGRRALTAIGRRRNSRTMGRRVTIGSLVLGARPLVVAAGGEAEVAALATADGADLLELRADLFADPQPGRVVRALEQLRASGRPVILTVRAATEGGRPLPDDRRQALYTAGLAHVDAIDVEI